MAYTDIDDPSAYFQTAIYTGNGGSSQAVTFNGNSDMQPDWLWLKVRSHSGNHFAYDSVRGATKALVPNDTDSEDTSYGYFSSFDSDGFTLGSADNNVNGSGRTYVGWGWKAGTAFSNDASSTSVGTVDSAGSVNQDAGFSIVSYTNTNQSANSGVATIKHGLNTTPNVMILKDRDATSDWQVFHSSVPTNKYLDLNTTDAAAVDTNVWNNTAPTSSVFTVGDNSYSNPGNRAMIAYCFAEKQGYSKFGSYVANGGGADSTFVYLGFKPAWIMVKKSSGTQSWYIGDNKRLGYNPKNENVNADTSGTEFSQDNWDVLSNGFKIKNNGAGVGTDGDTYIFMAFAEQPFVTSTGVPATAR